MWTRTVLLRVLMLSCIVAATLSQDTTVVNLVGVQAGTAPPVAVEVATAGANSEPLTTAGDLPVLVVEQATAGPALPEPQPEVADGDVIVQPGCGDGDIPCKDATTAAPVDVETSSIASVTVGAVVTQPTAEQGPVSTDATDTQTEETKAPSANESVSAPGGEKVTTAQSAVTEKVVTELVTEDVTTTTSITVTTRIWPADDPCNTGNHKVLSDPERHFAQTVQKGTEPLSDSELITGWYGFDYNNQSAIITTSCIKENQCSTIMPYYYKTQADTPEIGEQIDDGTIYGPGNVAGEINCCLKPITIKIRNCDTRLIYHLQKVELLLASICIQLPGEVVDDMYLAIPPQTTTAVPTTPRPTLPWKEYQRDDKGIVTVEYNFPQNKQDTDFLIESFDAAFRTMIAKSLNTMPVPDASEKTLKIPNVDPDADSNGPEDTRKRRETDKHSYSSDDVIYTGMTPTATGETLQVPLYVEDPESGRVPTDRMMGALKSAESSGAISKDVGLTMERYYVGLPDGVAPLDRKGGAGTWERHRDLLIALIVLIAICLLIIFIGLCCLRCRKNRGSWSRADDKEAMQGGNCGHSGKKRLMVVENPMPDSEIMRDESPMMERDNPAMTSNGGGGHLSKKDDDNGWVVPIDELSKAEKEKPEVEDTKL